VTAYLSICSGIESATVAWHPLGWTPFAFAEIEPFPCAVLKAHHPHVPNLGDITSFKNRWPDAAAVDVLVGGTPCQSFSVAGFRAGLADPRGNLTLVYLAIADRYRPRWVLWENVPGVLSSNGGRDFGAFLGGLVELGYGFAYRVLDAQFVRVDGFERAVPQRRRRVFVVGYLGDWRRAAAVLFERESLSWDHPPRRETRQRIAPTVEARANAGGAGWGTDFLVEGGMVASAVADPICANEQRTYTHEGEHNFRTRNVIAQVVANPLTHRMHKGVNTTMDEGQTMVAHAFDMRGREHGVQFAGPHDTASIRAASGGSSKSYVANWAVRRLTPRECERLQGFPDDFTLIRWRGKPAADGPRYKAVGNSMAVNCMRWLGRRIEHVNAIGGC
jgi:DNA (cytosine-5)-methyltransferase 1